MKVEICNEDIAKIAKNSQDAITIAQEFAKASGQEFRKLSESIESLRSSSSQLTDSELKQIQSLSARVEKLELTFEQLRTFLVEKTPTGKQRSSSMGVSARSFFQTQKR